jgi:hypothetical protein
MPKYNAERVELHVQRETETCVGETHSLINVEINRNSLAIDCAMNLVGRGDT